MKAPLTPSQEHTMPTSNPTYAPAAIRGELNRFPNAIVAFKALIAIGITKLPEMSLFGDFGQDEHTQYDTGCAGIGATYEDGLDFKFFNDGQVEVYVPKA